MFKKAEASLSEVIVVYLMTLADRYREYGHRCKDYFARAVGTKESIVVFGRRRKLHCQS